MIKRFKILADITVGIALLISSLSHLTNPFAFLESIDNYRMLSHNWVALAAGFLPWLQLTLSTCLLTKTFNKGASLIGLCMFQSFVIAQTVAWARGLDISCGCFGDGEHPISFWSISLAQTMAFLCLPNILITSKPWGFRAFELAEPTAIHPLP